jgi:hypothetical protein
MNKILFLFATLVAFSSVNGQEHISGALEFDVYRVYPYISVSKEQLREVRTLEDLNPHYKPSWVSSYIYVEVITRNKGKTMKAIGENEILSLEQLHNMKTADTGSEISVNVQYIPENKLTHNEPREINFSFTPDPEQEAQFIGGKQGLKLFLKENALEKIPAGTFGQFQLAAVKFTIDEQGRVTDPHLFWTSENEKTDALLLETVCNMPMWKPAAYANGIKVKQEFVLTVGDMESCVVPLLNIRRD